jgi:hypothetical protein
VEAAEKRQALLSEQRTGKKVMYAFGLPASLSHV